MLNLLSDREKEVLELIAHENTNDKIAEKLYISIHTAKTHRKNLLEKMRVKNTAGPVRRGFELGFLQIENAVQQIAEPTLKSVSISCSEPRSAVFQRSFQEMHNQFSRPFIGRAILSNWTGS
ncbi:MAG: helix-turn-helix transcriptional regulator [Saprospiraceae bacterium]|nr:helix-turn-helix transcriptional regulator [Saprospiraceae bacterium]